MSRTIPAPLLASTTAAQLNPFFATSLDFDAGTVRYWTGYGTITIGSVTYAGLHLRHSTIHATYLSPTHTPMFFLLWGK